MEPASAIRNLPLSNAIASSCVPRYLQMVGMTDWLSPLSASCGHVPYQRCILLITVIERVVTPRICKPRAGSLTRYRLLSRDHGFQFRPLWNDDPRKQVRDDAWKYPGSERDEEAKDAHERCVEIEVLS